MGSTQASKMSFPTNFESEKRINISKLTEMELPCEAHIVYKNTMWSRKARTIKLVMWNREFMFDIENGSDNCRVIIRETHTTMFAELLDELRQINTCSARINEIAIEHQNMLVFIDAVINKFYSHNNYSSDVGEKASWIIRFALATIRDLLAVLQMDVVMALLKCVKNDTTKIVTTYNTIIFDNK